MVFLTPRLSTRFSLHPCLVIHFTVGVPFRQGAVPIRGEVEGGWQTLCQGGCHGEAVYFTGEMTPSILPTLDGGVDFA